MSEDSKQITDQESQIVGESSSFKNHEPRSKNKLVWWVLGILVLVSIGFGGWYFGKSQNPNDKLQTNPNNQNSNLPTNQPIIETVKITGKVINKITEEGVSGAKVAFGDSQATADGSGSFSLSVPKDSARELSVSADGFIAVTSKPSDGAAISLVPQGKVAYISNKDGGKRGIYTINYDGSQSTPLVVRIDDKEDYNIAVSPRNRYVAFLSTRDGRKNRNGSDAPVLYLIKMDGSSLTKISEFYDINSVQWSPDGTYLAWVGKEKDEDNNQKIAVRDIDKGTTVYNGDPGESLYNYSFAKDDSKLSFSVSYNQTTPSRQGIYVADGNGSNPKKVSGISGYPQFNDDDNIEFSEWKDNKNHYYTWFRTGGEVKETGKRDDSKTRAGVKSPDKSLVAYIENRDGKKNVFVSKPDKSGEKQLTDISAASSSPRWSPDGKYITFDVYKTDESAKYIVSGEGKGKAQKITDQLSNGGGMGEYN